MTLPRRARDLEPIEAAECERLLADTPYVRLGFDTPQGPTIRPVNHLLVDGDLYFRTDAGSKLASAAAESRVAVEADGGDANHRWGWSVVGHGVATIVTDEALIERLLSFDFTPWSAPDAKTFWVRIRFDALDGRRIREA